MYLGKKSRYYILIICITLLIFAYAISVNAIEPWAPNVWYAVGVQITYGGLTYTCIQAHTSLIGWEPPNVPALWSLATGATPTNSSTNSPTNTPTSSSVATPTVTNTFTPTATSSSVTPTATPTATVSATSTLRSGITWGTKVFAPYVDITFPTPFSINSCHTKTTQKYYTLAFIDADCNGDPAWAGRNELNINTNYYMDEINNIRSKGGDVIVSFGGVCNTEMARHWANTDVSTLQSKYQAVVTKYKLTWIDLNIENPYDISDTAAVDRRNKAIKGLQLANPGLQVSYCLPVLPTGLTPECQYIIQNAKDNGVRVDVVNVMTMNFGDYNAPNPEGNMDTYSIQAAQSTRNQLVSMGLSSTKVGITPMIGQNDCPTERFYQADAQTVLSYAQSNSWIRIIGIWSGTRDNGSGGVQPAPPSPYYSSISQSEFEFTNILKAYK